MIWVLMLCYVHVDVPEALNTKMEADFILTGFISRSNCFRPSKT